MGLTDGKPISMNEKLFYESMIEAANKVWGANKIKMIALKLPIINVTQKELENYSEELLDIVFKKLEIPKG